MKITAVEVLPVRIPIEGQHAESVSAAVARVRTDEGLDAFFEARFAEGHDAVETVAVGDRGCRKSELRRAKMKR